MNRLQRALAEYQRNRGQRLRFALVLFIVALVLNSLYAPWDPGAGSFWALLKDAFSFPMQRILFFGIDEIRKYQYFLNWTEAFENTFQVRDYYFQYYYTDYYRFIGIGCFGIMFLVRKLFKSFVEDEETEPMMHKFLNGLCTAPFLLALVFGFFLTLISKNVGEKIISWATGTKERRERTCDFVTDFFGDNFFAYIACVCAFTMSSVVIPLAFQGEHGNIAMRYLTILIFSVMLVFALLVAPTAMCYSVFLGLVDWLYEQLPWLVAVIVVLFVALLAIPLIETITELVYDLIIKLLKVFIRRPILWIIPVLLTAVTYIYLYRFYFLTE